MAEIGVKRVADLPDRQSFELLSAKYGGVFFTPSLIAGAGADVEQLALFEGDAICGGFLVQRIKLKGIPTIANPAYHPHCSLFFVPSSNDSESLKRYLDAICNWLKIQPAKIFTISFPPEITDVQPFIWGGFKSAVKYTYRFHFSDDEVLSRISSKRRNLIRSAEKDGVVVEKCGLKELLTGLHFSGQSKGFAVNDEAIAKILTTGVAYKATANGETIASALFVDDEKSRYYLFGGADRNANGGALSAIIYRSMCEAEMKGLKIFDFEGSMIPGVELFFRSFGGNLTPYFTISKAPYWLSPLLRWKGKPEF
ncbi:MAG: hypothetical protein GC193_00430 [Cryomorphaceae bacterium]|nr:hypothetical protein [Cryomorphaceae bacterium]